MFFFLMATKAKHSTKNVVPFKQAFNKGKNENNVVSVLGKIYNTAIVTGVTIERKMISDL